MAEQLWPDVQLTADLRYDFRSREVFFLDLVPLPLDAKLADFCRRLAESSPADRTSLRSSARVVAPETFMTFSRRCASLAIRNNDAGYLTSGLNAMAAINISMVDYRDVSTNFTRLDYVATVFGESPEDLFGKAASLAENRDSEHFLKYLRSAGRLKGVDHMCLTVVQSKEGPSLIRRSIYPYAPTVPLDRLAVKIAELIHADKYSPEVELGTRFPNVRLHSEDDTALLEIIARIRAGATIRGTPREIYSQDPRDQMFVVYLIEAGNAADVNSLLELTESDRAFGGDVALLGAGRGSIFCLLVARSAVQGRAPLESMESVKRFQKGLEEILSAS